MSDRLILMSEQRDIELDRYKAKYRKAMGHDPQINENWSLEDIIWLTEELDAKETKPE